MKPWGMFEEFQAQSKMTGAKGKKHYLCNLHGVDLMGGLLDKELVGRSQPEGSDQWLNVQMDAGDKWCPSGVHTGTSAV